MRQFLTITLLALLAALPGAAQPYSLASVPSEWKEKANVIVHQDETVVEITGIDQERVFEHSAYTVLGEEGRDYLFFSEYTDDAISLEEVEIKVYDANGKQTNKYKKKDLTQQAYGEGLVPDGFVNYLRIPVYTYPVTIEIRTEKKIKSTLAVPDFRYTRPKMGVVSASYTAKVVPEIRLRYLAKNCNLQPEITDDGKFRVYKWSVSQVSPINYEEGSAAARDRYPQVLMVADRFSHYGREGDLSSWKSFGSWIRDLYKGLDDLPADRQQFFKNLVQDAPNEAEKIHRIYDYLQQNFRYVNISLGIGGLQPFSAAFTDKKKYGDCKGLSTYMKAALKSVGIPSYVAIINAESNAEPVNPQFPANEFNHVIVCIPRPSDSIWLECTSSTSEFGVLGTFTENRNALLITEEGGVLVPTPRSRPEENQLHTKTVVTVDPDLSGLSQTLFRARGQYDEIINEMLKDSRDDQKQALVFYFGFKQPDDFQFEKKDEKSGEAELKLALSKVPEFNAGSKYFVNSRMYKVWSRSLPKAEERKNDFYFSFPFVKSDTTVFRFPAGFRPDALPNPVELRCPYASYRTRYWFEERENAIYSATTLTLQSHHIPVADYAQVKKFFDDLIREDSQKLVVQNNGGEKKAF